MRTKLLFQAITSLTLLIGCETAHNAQKNKRFAHDMTQPRPPVVTPGKTPSDPPSHAIVLFDGTDLSKWESEDGAPARWIVKNGYVQVNQTGNIVTKKSFGSCHLHIEWAVPAEPEGHGQGRGNSGVYLMKNYEVQVLDSYKNDTYPDGQAAAIYGRSAPLVNACKPPGKWQTYDIIFHRPIFNDDEVVKPATITILHNGVLVQDHFELPGGTGWLDEHTVADYEPHPDKLSLLLQDHGNPIRFRNIWLVELDD